MPCFQAKNKKTGAWVKYERKKNGQTVIKNVKQRQPSKPFSGVPKKKKR